MINDKKFWEFIKKTKWTKDYNYNRIKKEIKEEKYFKKEEKEEYEEKYLEKYNILYKIAILLSKKEYQKYINQSDDGLSDLISNVIGNGQEHFDKVIKDYKKFKNYEAIENFKYCFF